MDSDWETHFKSLTAEPNGRYDFLCHLDEREDKLKALKALQSRRAEMNKKIEERKALHLELDMYEENEIAQAGKRLERERNEGVQKHAQFQQLTEEFSKLTERTHELQRQIQRQAVYLDFLERTAKMTEFKTAERFTDHWENILYIGNKLFQKDSEKWEEVNQLKKTCVMLKNQQRFLQLQNNTKLLELHAELQQAGSGVQAWEKQWNHLQKTATEKQIKLGQIKIATLNLFELTGDKEHVDIHDMDTQLDKVKLFFLDHSDIPKQFHLKHFHRKAKDTDTHKKNKQKNKKQK
ncbi:uncharacterized protein V6R79_018578 [Siganus canaliculatus]